MMFGKNRISFNIIMDIVMLITMVLVSISGFILKVVIPSRQMMGFFTLVLYSEMNSTAFCTISTSP